MSELAKRIKREELYEAVWTKTLKLLAKEWKTTYLRLVQACEELQIPRPGPGHWVLVARGFQVEREPLLELTANLPQETGVALAGVSPEERAAALVPPARARRERDQLDLAGLVTDETAAKPARAEGQGHYLSQAAERAVLDIIRQATRIDFWRESISESVYPGSLRAWLELGEGVKVTEGTLERTVKNVRKEYRSFLVRVEEAKHQYEQSSLVITVSLREGFEWKDVWEESWMVAERRNPHCLCDNALRCGRRREPARNPPD